MWPGLSQVTLPFGLNLALSQATGVAPLEEDGERKQRKLYFLQLLDVLCHLSS